MANQRIRTGDIQVDGLRELSRELKGMDKGLARELQKANKAVAEDVVTGAKSRAAGLGGVAAKAGPFLRASAGQLSASVILDGSRYPWMPGAEFGGGRRPTTQQFEPWRGSGSSAGYFVYPEIRESADERVESYEQALDRLLAKAFPD